MGELRNSIVELGKQVASAAKMGNSLGEELEKLTERAGSLVERVYGGHEVLWLYLEASFKKNGRKVDDFKNDKLAQHADSEILSYLKGIDQAVNDAVKVINEFAAIKNKMPAEYQRIESLATSIQRNIEKKRAKLFQSKKYKAKLVTYEKALGELVQAITDRRKAFEKIDGKSLKGVEAMRLKPTNKLGDIQYINVKAEIANVKAAEQNNVVVARKMRGNGDLRKALDTMKVWAGEADSMDQEVINLDPNAVKPIKDVKIFAGSTLLCSAPKAIFQGKRPMEVSSVTWARGISATNYLQKKVRVEGKYVAGDGNLVHDMKVNGIKGDTVKLS